MDGCVAFVGGGSRIVRLGDYRQAFAWATATSPRYGCFSTLYQTTQNVTEWSACDDCSTSTTRVFDRNLVPGTRIDPGNDACTQVAPTTAQGSWEPQLPAPFTKPYSKASDGGAD